MCLLKINKEKEKKNVFAIFNSKHSVQASENITT